MCLFTSGLNRRCKSDASTSQSANTTRYFFAEKQGLRSDSFSGATFSAYYHYFFHACFPVFTLSKIRGIPRETANCFLISGAAYERYSEDPSAMRRSSGFPEEAEWILYNTREPIIWNHSVNYYTKRQLHLAVPFERQDQDHEARNGSVPLPE